MAHEKGLRNVVQISSLDIPTYLTIFRKSGEVVALFGPPGVGKTKAVEAWAADEAARLGKTLVTNPKPNDWKNPNNFCVGTLLTSVIEETDVVGYPHVENDNGEMVARYALNELLPIEGCGVVFMDEFPNGRTQVQNALQRILLEHRIGNYVVSKDIQFIVAGNRPSDNCGTFYIPSALRNRVGWFEVSRPKIEDWLELMESIGQPINPTIAAWMLSIGSKYFDNFDPKAEQYAFGTTRSVTKASKMLEGITDHKIMEKVVGSLIGADAGQDLVMFMKLTEKVDMTGLLQNPTAIHKYEDDLGVLYSIALNLVDKFADDSKYADNVMAILGETNRKEIGAYALKSILSKMGSNKALERITKCKNGKEVMLKYHKLIQATKGM